MPNFSYSILQINIPTSSLPDTIINLELCELPKQSTAPAVYLKHYMEVVDDKYKNVKLYTDGSKADIGVGSAATYGCISRKAGLPKLSSIFFAELYAIQMALSIIENITKSKFIIFSDSASSLRALQNTRNEHPLV